MIRRALPWIAAAAVVWLPDVVFAAVSPEAGDHGGHDGHGGGIVWFNSPVGSQGKTGVIWLVINFVVLMWLLEKILFSKLREGNRNKHDTIKSRLQEATEAKAEAQSLVAEYRDRLKRLDDEIDTLMKDAKERAEADRARIIETAEREAERIKQLARVSAEREAASHKRRIEAEIVDRAVQRAEAVLREQIQAGDQTRLVDAYVEQLAGVELQSAPGRSS